MIDLSLDIRNQAEFRRAMRALGKNMNDPRAIRRFLRPGVKPIREGIRNATPKSARTHHYYKKGRKFATFKPGHLRKSTQDIANIKRGYKKVPTIYIGPVYTRDAGQGGVFGNTMKNVDAYYAHMVLGSARAYEQQVIQVGYNNAKAAAESLILREAAKVVQEQGKKAGFQ